VWRGVSKNENKLREKTRRGGRFRALVESAFRQHAGCRPKRQCQELEH